MKVGGESGVPLLWRGCSAGCLDSLVADPYTLNADPAGFDQDGDWDMDTDDAVPVVQRVDESDGEGRLGVIPAQSAADGQLAPFSSEGFEFDD